MTRLLAACALAIALATAACSSNGEDDPVITPPSPSASATSASPSATVSASPSSLADVVVRVQYRNGQVVTDESRVRVRKGSLVLLEVTSDKADEVHVHGYDKSFDVAPGKVARFEFVASIPGQWEVELHDAGDVLVRLQVQ